MTPRETTAADCVRLEDANKDSSESSLPGIPHNTKDYLHPILTFSATIPGYV